MTLIEFLLDRIADDEHFGTHDRHLAKRWDVECEAKRQILGLCRYATDSDDMSDNESAMGEAILALLALPHADHPDYREEWKP